MIYFDNAATTFPKPLSVVSEVKRCMEEYCGNPGRSGHVLSVKAAEKIYDCRELLSSFLGSSNPTNVCFTPNTTYALNIAIYAFAKRKTHVLISNFEHNSVYRTVCSLASKGIDYDIFKVNPFNDEDTLCDIRKKIKSNTSMIVCTHVSNICGVTLPIEKIGKLAHSLNIKFIVDSAQGVGTHNINIEKCNIDALCCAGHKGLYGPQGTGFVIFADKYASPELLERTNTYIYGGNGYNSSEKVMPCLLPERYEGGTLNTPAIAGLAEGIKFVRSTGVQTILEHTSEIYNRCADMLYSLPNIKLYYDSIKSSSTLLFNIENTPPEIVADLLNNEQICVRSGLHCSPLAHKALKIENGAVRASFSYFNTVNELEHFYKAIKQIIFTY